MLKFIRTENFKKLGNFSCNFEKGTNLIVGENGHGKTTVFNAIRFALFGTSAIASSKEDIPTWGSKNCKVTATFDNFTVVRTLTDCKVYKASEGVKFDAPELKVAEGSRPCIEWIKDRLGLDHKMFSIFNMSMQGETGALITLGATELNRIVENFSGVGVIDKIIKSVGKETTLLEGAAGTVEFIDPTELKSEVKNLTEEYNQALKVKTDTVERYSNAKQLLKKADEDFKNAAAHNEEQNRLSSKVKSAQASIKLLTGQIERALEEFTALQGKVDQTSMSELSNNIGGWQNDLREFNQASDRHTRLEEKSEELAEKIKRCKEDHAKYLEVEQQYQALQSELDELTTKVGELQAKKSEAYSQVKDAKSALDSGVCSKCHRPFVDFNKEQATFELSKATKEYESLKESYSVEKNKQSELETKIHRLPKYRDDNLERAEEFKALKQEALSEILEIEEQYKYFDDEEVQKLLEGAQKQLFSYERNLADLARADKLCEQLKRELKEAEDICQGTQLKDLYDLKPLSEKVEQLSSTCETLEFEVNEAREEVSKFHGVLLNAENDLNKVLSDNKKFEQYAKDIDRGKRLVKYLRDSRVEYMQSVWATILGVASEFINATTNGWITAVGRNNQGEFTFTEEGITCPASSCASGAQKEFIGVALRIGLSLCLKGGESLLMLDEPTAGMTEENADKLASGLLGVAGQKVVITHRQSERLTAANIVRI